MCVCVHVCVHTNMPVCVCVCVCVCVNVCVSDYNIQYHQYNQLSYISLSLPSMLQVLGSGSRNTFRKIRHTPYIHHRSTGSVEV